MSNTSRRSAFACFLVVLCALGFLAWNDVLLVRRVEHVSGISDWSAADATAGVPVGWQPRLIVPEHDNESYEWLDQTRLMFALRELRVRHVDYENAPAGREEYAASPYRWWLGLIAWADHRITGLPLGISVERAALLADPLLEALLLVGAAIFVAAQFGAFPAAIFSVGLAAIFPLAAEFLPGVPGDGGLAQACAIWSVLPLLAGIGSIHSAGADAGRRARRWFLLAGVAGAIGMWVSIAHQLPVLVGIAMGGLIAAGAVPGDSANASAGAPIAPPWRIWALGGATACLAAYLVEYFPGHMGELQLRMIDPIYGLAWLGGGELLAQADAWIRQRKSEGGPPRFGGVLSADAIASAWIQRRRPGRSRRDNVAAALAAAALAAVPLAMWRTRNLGFMALDLPSLRLARLQYGPAATDFFAWIARDGFSSLAWATLLPLLLIVAAIWLLVRRRTGPVACASLAVALGPVLVAIGFACGELAWWSGVDSALLVLLAAAAASMCGSIDHHKGRWKLTALVAVALLPGAFQTLHHAETGAADVLSETDQIGQVERELARWMALHAEGRPAVILAPFNETVTLYYFGGLRGLATLGWENGEGFGAAIRIARAPTQEDARELIMRRGITHIVIPSWDSYLDAYARRGTGGQLEDTFMAQLHRWDLPPWLRPVPYPVLKITGFGGLSVAVFEVVEDQDEVTAGSRLAEYFAEMDQPELAASAAAALRRFPTDLSALVGRAQVEIARGDTDAFSRTIDLLLHGLSGGADRALPWDRRVGLAVVLAQGQHVDLARMEVIRCLADIDEARLRGLTTGSLYRLQLLDKALGLGIGDPRLHSLALELLPPEFRSRLGP